jgi:signal transduction histidine kinase/CheY-like chemotaxis protein
MSELIVPERLREGHERGLRRYLATGETTILDERIEITAVRRDGTEIPVELSVTAVTLPSGTLFTGFVRDVTDRKRAEQDIRELNAELEQRVIERTSELARTVRQLEQVGDQLREESAALEVASRHKSDFLASMSHELRTPLNAIIGFSEVLLDHAATVPDEQRGTFLEYIRSSGQHLLGLINDILDLAKVEAGRMELRPEPVAINGVIEDCVSMMRVVAEAKHVSLESTIEPGDGIAVVDQPRLKQIIYNLLSNAVKFTPAGGFVAIHAVLTEQELRVEVRDSGVGIPRDEQELIFDEFRQSSATAPGQGTGLGLALVRKLVYLHGGRIWVESALGEGSCFTFVLPQRLLARNIERTAANGPVDALAKGGRLSILVVEDQREAAELLMLHLLRGGYDAFRASSAEEALRLAREVRPFAITLDILLPDRDGWDVLSKLKADPATRDIPVVVVSVVDNQELGFALGATDYLVKPFDRERLLDSLSHLREEPGRGKPTVLLVDGDQDDDNTYSRVLRSAGYEIVQAVRGANALKAVRDQQPDLVVLDVASPDLGALELVGELRSSPETRHVPIVVCTDVQLSEQQHNLLRGQVRSIVPKSGGAPNDVLQELLSLERLNPGLAQIVGGPTGYAVAERFLAHIDRELNRAARYGGRFSVVVIRAGDEQEARSERYLQQLCQGIAAELRQHDVVAHDDTGEIFVLLPNLEPERAPSLVSRFLTIVWSVRADHLSVVSHVKVGYASYPSDARSAQALLEAARNRGALYAEPG